MKSLLLLLCILLSLQGGDFNIKDTLEENKDKAIEIQNTIKAMATKTLKTMKSKMRHLNVQEAQNMTYEVKVLTKNGTTDSSTAVALSSNGKLITAYHNIDNYKTIIVIDAQGNEYTPTVGKISIKNDLAYLHIDVKNITYASLATDTQLGENLYMLNYEKLLLSAIASQIKDDSIVLNVGAKKGTSGGGIFNDGNQLVSILISKDVLNKTSYSVRPNVFDSITETFRFKSEGTYFTSNNYDSSYCYDEDDLKVWKQNEKSSDLKVQEFHALFIGLCKKVENKDLTTEQARYIFEDSRTRLFDKIRK